MNKALGSLVSLFHNSERYLKEAHRHKTAAHSAAPFFDVNNATGSYQWSNKPIVHVKDSSCVRSGEQKR
jgi:hypothetical protein